MRYLITGITGFLGPHLANLLLKEGHSVAGLVRGSNGMESDILDVVDNNLYSKIDFLYGNIEDRIAMHDIFQIHGFDGVFHCGAQSHPPTGFTHPIETMSTNVMGTANIVEAVERYQRDCKIMFCSTSEVYGNTGKDGQYLKESDPMAPCNPYAVSKACSDLYLQERFMNGKTNGFITRSFSHTGPRRGKNFSISSDAYQIARIQLGLQPPELEVGNLATVRTVIDVRDVARAYYLLMINEKSIGGIFNICGETPREMGFFTDYLIEISGVKNIKKTISDKYYRKHDIFYQIGDTKKVSDLTGWRPEIPIEQTLTDLFNYWVNNLHM